MCGYNYRTDRLLTDYVYLEQYLLQLGILIKLIAG